ncbi:MAG: hypothetical protein Q8N99_03110 [Nanoarchaeota archaeon]|nr:hypothetical protein [Nanoarchaeota archaeon]
MKKYQKYLIAGTFFLLIVLLLFSYYINLNIFPEETYRLSRENMIYDGSFENFVENVSDCCSNMPGKEDISALKSPDSIDKYFSLNLTSSNHCACINKEVDKIEKEKKYIFSFFYKGDNAHVCLLAEADNNCSIMIKVGKSREWNESVNIFSVKKSQKASVYFYADSGGEKISSNFYDKAEIRELTKISGKGPFMENVKYVIKTKKTYTVNGYMIGEAEDNKAYFLITGKPKISEKFPINDFIALLIMIYIIIRILSDP